MEPTPSDLETLRVWWSGLRPEVPDTARGLWFGITELQSGGAYRTLYVAGCPTYDADDLEGEWATDYCWWPADRYVTLAGFATLPDQPYQEVLTYAAKLVRALTVTALPTVEGAAVGLMTAISSSSDHPDRPLPTHAHVALRAAWEVTAADTHSRFLPRICHAQGPNRPLTCENAPNQ